VTQYFLDTPFNGVLHQEAADGAPPPDLPTDIILRPISVWQVETGASTPSTTPTTPPDNPTPPNTDVGTVLTPPTTSSASAHSSGSLLDQLETHTSAAASAGSAWPAFLSLLDQLHPTLPDTPEVKALLDWITANAPASSPTPQDTGGTVMVPAEVSSAPDAIPATVFTPDTNAVSASAAGLTSDSLLNFAAPIAPGGHGSDGDSGSGAGSSVSPVHFDGDVSPPISLDGGSLDTSFFDFDWTWFGWDSVLHKSSADFFGV
jgi:hypothetical protein